MKTLAGSAYRGNVTCCKIRVIGRDHHLSPRTTLLMYNLLRCVSDREQVN